MTTVISFVIAVRYHMLTILQHHDAELLHSHNAGRHTRNVGATTASHHALTQYHLLADEPIGPGKVIQQPSNERVDLENQLADAT